VRLNIGGGKQIGLIQINVGSIAKARARGDARKMVYASDSASRTSMRSPSGLLT
jgi:hypothetical protein